MNEPICINCIYFGEPTEVKRRRGLIHYRPLEESKENYICKNLNNGILDYISGATKLMDCKTINEFGACLYYEAIEDDTGSEDTDSSDTTDTSNERLDTLGTDTSDTTDTSTNNNEP